VTNALAYFATQSVTKIGKKVCEIFTRMAIPMAMPMPTMMMTPMGMPRLARALLPPANPCLGGA